MGVGKLPGVGNWFFTRDGQSTETLGGWILPLWGIPLSHHILGVQPYPVKMLALISASCLNCVTVTEGLI